MKNACYLFLAAGFLWRAVIEEDRFGRFASLLNSVLFVLLFGLNIGEARLPRGKTEEE